MYNIVLSHIHLIFVAKLKQLFYHVVLMRVVDATIRKMLGNIRLIYKFWTHNVYVSNNSYLV